MYSSCPLGNVLPLTQRPDPIPLMKRKFKGATVLQQNAVPGDGQVMALASRFSAGKAAVRPAMEKTARIFFMSIVERCASFAEEEPVV